MQNKVNVYKRITAGAITEQIGSLTFTNNHSGAAQAMVAGDIDGIACLIEEFNGINYVQLSRQT